MKLSWLILPEESYRVQYSLDVTILRRVLYFTHRLLLFFTPISAAFSAALSAALSAGTLFPPPTGRDLRSGDLTDRRETRTTSEGSTLNNRLCKLPTDPHQVFLTPRRVRSCLKTVRPRAFVRILDQLSALATSVTATRFACV